MSVEYIRSALKDFFEEVNKLPDGGVDPESGLVIIPKDKQELQKKQVCLLDEYILDKPSFVGIDDKKLITSLAGAGSVHHSRYADFGGSSECNMSFRICNTVLDNPKLSLVLAKRATREQISAETIEAVAYAAVSGGVTEIANNLKKQKILDILIGKASDSTLEKVGNLNKTKGCIFAKKTAQKELKRRGSEFGDSLDLPERSGSEDRKIGPIAVTAMSVVAALGTAGNHYLRQNTHNQPPLEPDAVTQKAAIPGTRVDTTTIIVPAKEKSEQLKAQAEQPPASYVERSEQKQAKAVESPAR